MAKRSPDGDLDSNFIKCPACDSPRLERLGMLGKREHYRCRDCGAQCSHLLENQEDDLRVEEGVEPDLVTRGEDLYAEAEAARWDDDPSPYDGTYSEE
jgi:DNA-directed RNA polymerase subunit RPC12/RpoP